MRRAPLAVAVGSAWAWAACAAPGPAVLDSAAMPGAWRPRAGEAGSIGQHPWTVAEERACAEAAWVGLREMAAFFEERPARIVEQGENAIEAFLDASYGATDPEFSAFARRWAARCTEAVAAAALAAGDPPNWATLIVLAGYGDRALGRDHPLTGRLVARANDLTPAAIADAIGFDAPSVLEGAPENDTVYDLVMWSISLLDAAGVSGLALPTDAAEVVRATWEFVATHPFPGARGYVDGADDFTFYAHAYTATHIGYVPTGYGRHRLRVEDAPWLYRFLRENFYPVLAMGELDLVAEFVDLLRQYGCTPATDRQCRDGTRFLLARFDAAGRSWIGHRESYEVGEPVSDYDLLHKPWTAIAGVRDRQPEPAGPGSYRWRFERALGR